ncbi:MAG: BatD family protein [Chloroflexota bacterium]|nr:BatD family protein [Chloroflexota bacterium]
MTAYSISYVRIKFLCALCVLAALLNTPANALAQDNITFTASVDRTIVSTDGYVQLTLALQGQVNNVPAPELPPMDGFYVVGSSRSQQFSFVNGALSASVNFVYRLQPLAVGQQTIGPARVTINGQTYETQPITIEVTDGAAPAPTTAPGQTGGDAPPELAGQAFYVEAEVDKPVAYLGEQVTYTFRFYQAQELMDSPRYGAPQWTGFWAERMEPQNQYLTSAGGVNYRVTELNTAIFPVVTGEQTINPATLEIPGGFFQSGQTLQTQPVTVQVQPLPTTGQPADFNGAVGQYTVRAAAEPLETRVNEPINLYFEVSGTGNVSAVPEPAWPQVPGMRAYDASSTSNTTSHNYIIGGAKRFERLYVPEQPGEHTIPSFTLSYFDPISQTYRTVSTEPIAVAVAPGAAGPVAPGGNSQDVTLLGSDIRHIKAAPPELEDESQWVIRSAGFWAAWVLPLLAVVGAFVIQLQRHRLQGDPAYARRRRARKQADRRLKAARQALDAGNSDGFYGELTRALIAYIADKLNVPAAGLTFDGLRERLAGREIPADLVEQVSDAWQESEQSRFAPVGASREAQQALLERIAGLIVMLEGLKW